MAIHSDITQTTNHFRDLRQLESAIISIKDRLKEPISHTNAQATLRSTIASVSSEHQLTEKASMVLSTLFETSKIPSDTNIYTVNFTNGRDPRENNAVKNALKDAITLFQGDNSDARNYYIGILFNAILNDPKAKLTWDDAEIIFDANCSLMEVSKDDYQIVQLSAKGKKVKEHLNINLFKSHESLRSTFEDANYPKIIIELLEKYKPRYTFRRVSSSDRSQSSTLESNSRILQEACVTGIELSLDEGGKQVVGRSSIYIDKEVFSNLAEPLSHELIELGIMDYCLRHLTGDHKDYVLQHLASYNVTDFLVYMVQLDQLKECLKIDEKHNILKKAFSFGLRLIMDRDKILSVFSEQDPLAFEIASYSLLMENLFNNFMRNDTTNTTRAMNVAIKEPIERTTSENEYYCSFIERFTKSFMLSVQATYSRSKDIRTCLLDDCNKRLLGQ